MIKFKLEDSEYIELIKLLKITNIWSSGGEAKHVVDDGEVKRNGRVETRKRAKLIAGDKIDLSQFKKPKKKEAESSKTADANKGKKKRRRISKGVDSRSGQNQKGK